MILPAPSVAHIRLDVPCLAVGGRFWLANALNRTSQPLFKGGSLLTLAVMPQTTVWILIAAGFDEEAVVSCLCQMRQAGTAATLAGTPVHRVVGAAGLVVLPDCSLGVWQERVMEHGRQLVIIPGGPACATRLLSDARVYQGIQNTLSQCGQIAVLAPNMLPVLSGMGVLSAAWHEQFFIQENGDTANFIHHLVHFVADTGQ